MASANVTGTVASLNSTGTGFRVEESWEGREGRQSRRYWSVWFPKDTGGMAPPIGSRVKVNGLLSTKVSERDARYVDHTLNEARVELLAAPAAPAAEPVDAWSTPGSFGDDSLTPF
jgi:hypothetical protein